MDLLVNLVILNLGLFVGFYLGFNKGSKRGYEDGVVDALKKFDSHLKLNFKSSLDNITAQKLMNELIGKN